MYRELIKKKIILDRRMPFKDEVQVKISEKEMLDLAQTVMRLMGSTLTRKEIEDFYYGDIPENANIIECSTLQNVRDIRDLLYKGAGLKIGFTYSFISKIYEMLTGSDDMIRTNIPVDYTWDYVPVHPSEIDERMTQLLSWISTDPKEEGEKHSLELPELQDSPSDFVLRATYFHLRLLYIYPFKEANSAMAWILTCYFLMSCGMGIVGLGMSEVEYNTAVSEALKTGNTQPLYKAILRSVYNNLDYRIEMTK